MTHATDAGLLRAILEHPEDDVARLVYSDWLEEQGQAERAAFIRLQIRIATLESNCRCGRCVQRRGGGQHHNGPCAVDKERDELPDGRSKQALLRMRERELWEKHGNKWEQEIIAAIGYNITSRSDVDASNRL